MVNAPRMHQEKREEMLRQIEASINKAITEKQNITHYKTLMAITANLGVSKRTAKEYLETVLFRMGMVKEDLDTGKLPSAKVQADRQLKFVS